MQTVEIKVRMDCEGCERKVRKAVEGMKGLKTDLASLFCDLILLKCLCLQG